jgi:hypothetical protein
MQIVCSYAFPMGLHVLNCLLTRELLAVPIVLHRRPLRRSKRRTS